MLHSRFCLYVLLHRKAWYCTWTYPVIPSLLAPLFFLVDSRRHDRAALSPSPRRKELCLSVIEKKQTAERLSESLAEVQRLIALHHQDDAIAPADLAGDLPRQVVYEVMGELDETEREQLQSALSYPEGSSPLVPTPAVFSFSLAWPPFSCFESC